MKKMILVPASGAVDFTPAPRHNHGPLVRTPVADSTARQLENEMEQLLSSRESPWGKLSKYNSLFQKYSDYYNQRPGWKSSIDQSPSEALKSVESQPVPETLAAQPFFPTINVDENTVVRQKPVVSANVKVQPPEKKKARIRNLSRYDIIRSIPENDKATAKLLLNKIEKNNSILDWDRRSGALKFKNTEVPDTNFTTLIKSMVASPETFSKSSILGADLFAEGLKTITKTTPRKTRSSAQSKKQRQEALGDGLSWGTVH